MYQAFNAPDIFGPPPSPDDDFTLQRRCREPDEGGGGGGGGGGIDDVLGWLGIPSPGGASRTGYDDPGGVGVFTWGSAGLRSPDETGFGQLMMETDNDESDCFDYSCLSSGLISPEVESEFFGAPYAGRHLPLRAPDPPYWSFNPTPPDCPPPSPLYADFRFNGATTGSDFSYPGVTSCDLPFDSEAEEKVKEIARYLASFEVQPWSVASQRSAMASNCGTPVSNPTSPFEEIGSVTSGSAMSASQSNGANATSGHTVASSSVGFFHAGFDDSCCGLETTIVNPSDIFPDHQYAASARASTVAVRPSRGRHSQRTSHRSATPPKVRASSVLEALLRSTEPIDPNKGSGAAVAMADDVEEEGEGDARGGPGRRSPERMLKKLLTGGGALRDGDLLGRRGQRGYAEAGVGYRRASGANSGATSGPAFPGFVDVKMEKTGVDECELARELGAIVREQTARKTKADYSVTSDFRSADSFRCN